MGPNPNHTPQPSARSQHDAPPLAYSSLGSTGTELQQGLAVRTPDNQPKSGFGSGAGIGASSGFVANVCLTLIWGVAQGQMNPGTATMSDRVGQFAAVSILLILFGTPVALALGFLAGGISGGLLTAAGMTHRAPIVFGIVAAAFPMLVIVVPAGTAFRLTVVGTAVCFGAIGTLAGTLFKRSFPDPS